jgi:hypothetical protein
MSSKSINPESSAGRALRALCQHKGPMPVPKPVIIGRRKTRPGAPYVALVKAGLATVNIGTNVWTYEQVKMYEPTDAGRILCATWA